MQLSRSHEETGRRCREAGEESTSGSQVTEVREIAGRKVSGYVREGRGALKNAQPTCILLTWETGLASCSGPTLGGLG